MAHSRNVTPAHDIADSKEELEALDRERRRDVNFSFIGLPIAKGTILQSVFDDKIECEVVGDKNVVFRGEAMSLSRSALIIAHDRGYPWKSIRGPLYWKYEGRTLLEIKESGAVDQEAVGS